MAGLSSKTVPHLADAIHAVVTKAVWETEHHYDRFDYIVIIKNIFFFFYYSISGSDKMNVVTIIIISSHD